MKVLYAPYLYKPDSNILHRKNQIIYSNLFLFLPLELLQSIFSYPFNLQQFFLLLFFILFYYFILITHFLAIILLSYI